MILTVIRKDIVNSNVWECIDEREMTHRVDLIVDSGGKITADDINDGDKFSAERLYPYITIGINCKRIEEEKRGGKEMKEKTYLFENKKLTVTAHGNTYDIILEKKMYGNKRIAIIATMDDGFPYATLSVNLPMASLGDDEVFIKSWSENEALAEVAKKSGYFKDTGRRIPTGFCVAEVWKMKGTQKEKPKPKKYKDHLCGEECDLQNCPDGEPCHCEHGLSQLADRAEMRADLARDAISDRLQKEK